MMTRPVHTIRTLADRGNAPRCMYLCALATEAMDVGGWVGGGNTTCVGLSVPETSRAMSDRVKGVADA